MKRSNFSPFSALKSLPRGMVFGSILLAALFAFEIFNYSTTDFALTDLLGPNLKFASIRWATILSFAFCGIDFAGIARIFTPEKGSQEPAEVWYLFGAWLLAAAMNAMLTWWGISVAVSDHTAMGSSLVSHSTLTRAVPVFVAIMVWLIRVLIIGTFSLAGENLFTVGERSHTSSYPRSRTTTQYTTRTSARTPQPKPGTASAMSTSRGVEPTYHPIGLSARGNDTPGHTRR